MLVLDNDGPPWREDRGLVGACRRLVQEGGRELVVVWPQMLGGRRKTDMNDILQREGEEGVYASVVDNMKRITL